MFLLLDCEDPDNTRVMIFTGLRSSVFDICDLLKLSSLEHVRPAPFMGQGMRAGGTSGRGQKQKEQLAIMAKFKVRATCSGKGHCTIVTCRVVNSMCLCRHMSVKRVSMLVRWI